MGPPEPPDLPTRPEPSLAWSEEAQRSGVPPRFGPSSRQIARGLAFAFVFALGSAAGYGLGVYGPRWWPMIAEWSHLAENMMNRNPRSGFASDFTTDHRAPFAERGAATTTPNGPAENKNLDGQTGEDHLAALMAECDRQIAEHRWGVALETYLQIVNEFPGSQAAAQLGMRLSAILWSEGTSAARAERLDEAVMLFGMLELLPPVPAEAILATDQRETLPRNSTPDDTAGSAALIDPPHTSSSVRSEVTSARPAEASDDSREVAAAAGAASDEARLRQEFERFLTERQQPPIGPLDRETLFVEFKNSLANGLVGTSAPTSAGKEGTRRVEIWEALDTTNLRELASAVSTVVGTVAKGSTFRVIARSDDGKWLKIETRDGLTGYYWAARAREMR